LNSLLDVGGEVVDFFEIGFGLEELDPGQNDAGRAQGRKGESTEWRLSASIPQIWEGRNMEGESTYFDPRLTVPKHRV
jgi:hypothetical protein